MRGEGADAPQGYALEDYGQLLRSHRRVLVASVLVTAVISSIVVLLVPPTFEATTTLMPVGGSKSSSVLGQFGVNLSDLGLQSQGGWDSPATYPDILRSRRLIEQLLEMRFAGSPGDPPARLLETIEPVGHGGERLERAVRAVRRSLSITGDRRTEILTLRVRSRYPTLAAGIANALDSLLIDFTIAVSSSNAGRNRRFIESRLAETETDLALAEDRLREFRQRNLRIGNSPRLALEEGRLARALRGEEEVYLTLRRQHELAKIEERRDTPSVVVLDPAAVPTLRAAPRRVLTVVGSVLIVFMLSVSLIIGRRSVGPRALK